MNHISILLLFALALYSCSPKQKKILIKKTDIEMAVINDVLPYLIPKQSSCFPAPLEGESNEDYDKRLKEFDEKFETSTKKIEIINLLFKSESTFIKGYRSFDKEATLKLLLNAPKKERKIDSTLLVTIKGVQIKIAKEPWKTGGPSSFDCSRLGQFNISRVGFNKDSTMAAFSYYVDNGSCTISDAGIIVYELKSGKWQIKK